MATVKTQIRCRFYVYVFVSCFLFFFECLPLQLAAQNDTVLLDKADTIIELGYYAKYFIDKNATLGIDEISSPSMKSAFQTAKEEVPDFVYEKGRIWCRISVRNDLKEDAYLQISFPLLRYVDVYLPNGNGQYSIESTGFMRPFNTRAFPNNNFLLKIRVETSQTITFFTSFQSVGAAFVPLKIGSLRSLTEYNRASEFISLAVIGLMLVMFFYNFSLFIFLRDRVYIYYLFYLVSAIFYTLFIAGYLFEWLWPDFPKANSGFWPIGLLGLSFTLLANKLLEVKENLPKLYNVSYLIYALSLFISFSASSIFELYPYTEYAVKVLNVIAPVYFLVCLASRKTKITLFLLIGWIPFLIALFLFALILNGIFYDEFLRVHGIELGMAWEVTAFSLVLGYRFNIIRKEKMEVQAENLRLVSEQNQLLEKKVAERTHEVEEQKQELQAQNEELVTQHEKLAEQNATIENQKHEVQAQNEELVAQQDKLVEQNAVIESQNKQLNEYNINLEGLVAARTKDLELANAELAHRYEQVTEFAFMTAHNLRGPVSRMIGLNNLIQQEQTFDKEIIGMLGTTAKDVDQVLRDITTVLDIKETHKIAFEHFDLKTLLDEILSEFSSTIENVQASVNTDLNFREVYSSRNFLRSVLTQLIENSIKFRKPDVRLTIDISSEVKESSMIIRVADNGLGLDMDLFKEKIFRLYQRYHTHREGKGFGLYLSRIMIESLGGSISAKSELGVGTVVEFGFPIGHRM